MVIHALLPGKLVGREAKLARPEARLGLRLGNAALGDASFARREASVARSKASLGQTKGNLALGPASAALGEAKFGLREG